MPGDESTIEDEEASSKHVVSSKKKNRSTSKKNVQEEQPNKVLHEPKTVKKRNIGNGEASTSTVAQSKSNTTELNELIPLSVLQFWKTVETDKSEHRDQALERLSSFNLKMFGKYYPEYKLGKKLKKAS